MDRLLENLERYCNAGYYPFHMPGHKRNCKDSSLATAYGMDITEIEGFDNLHHPEGMILEAEKNASMLYGSEETFFLINGSTCGLLSSIFALTCENDTILVARNSHKAVYNGIELRRLHCIYLYPPVDKKLGICKGISAVAVSEQLDKHPEVKAVLLTSPTYEGILSELEGIVKTAHEKGIPVIVDEAHGAHLGLSPDVPEGAIAAGADLVIHSVHKTLPSFTQTALLHVQGQLADRDRIKKYLAMFQTSSPSYLLMTGIDECVRYLQKNRKSAFREWKDRIERFQEKTSDLEWIVNPDELYKNHGISMEWSKILIFPYDTSLTGQKLARILREEYCLEVEMAAVPYVIAMTSVMDTEEGMNRLAEALHEIAKKEKATPDKKGAEKGMGGQTGDKERRQHDGCGKIDRAEKQAGQESVEMIMPAYEAINHPQRTVKIQDAEGLTAGEYVYAYPPGIPVLVPGERITAHIIEEILLDKASGLSLQGMKDYKAETIQVVI